VEEIIGERYLKTVLQTENFNRDDSKTVFNHWLLHVISLRGLGVKTNAKTAFKT